MDCFLGLLYQAVEIVAGAYPGSKFYQAGGRPSQGTATSADEIDTWQFIFLGPPQARKTTTIILQYQAGAFGQPVLRDEPFVGDLVIDLPIPLGLEGAIALKDAAGHTGPFPEVVLRWPLSPGDNEPYYIEVTQ